MIVNRKEFVEKSILWRTHNHHVDGVVIIFNGVVQGWCNELRNPEHWQAGCIAVDSVGACWKAVGGNRYDGAALWESI